MIESQRRSNTNKHNEQVKNKHIFKRFIDAICYLSNQELPLRSTKNPSNLLTKVIIWKS